MYYLIVLYPPRLLTTQATMNHPLHTGVYDCRHPLWGGQGSCIQSTTTHAMTDYCECDAGFAGTDALGQSSCVPKLALVTGYTLVALIGSASTMYL